MSAELQSWPRPHFAPGGGNPLLFYVVFGAFDLSRPLGRSKYRTAGVPPWLELVSYDRAKQPDVFADYQSDKMWELLKRDATILAAEAEQAPHCVALRGEPADPPTLDYFRDTVGIVTWLLDAGGLAVYDPQMLWLWGADEWREEVFEPNAPNPDRHTAILVSPEDAGTSWYHTRGMRKYGRPDLSVRGVGEAHADGVTLMIERFVELQALGGLIPDGEVIRMASLPANGVCRHAGSHDDPDFNNAHVEIAWPPGALV
jgi:hypothetical protein